MIVRSNYSNKIRKIKRIKKDRNCNISRHIFSSLHQNSPRQRSSSIVFSNWGCTLAGDTQCSQHSAAKSRQSSLKTIHAKMIFRVDIGIRVGAVGAGEVYGARRGGGAGEARLKNCDSLSIEERLGRKYWGEGGIPLLPTGAGDTTGSRTAIEGAALDERCPGMGGRTGNVGDGRTEVLLPRSIPRMQTN